MQVKVLNVLHHEIMYLLVLTSAQPYLKYKCKVAIVAKISAIKILLVCILVNHMYMYTYTIS